MNLDDCLGAGRPLIFVETESEVEVLRHLNAAFQENKLEVYSTSLAGLSPLDTYVKGRGKAKKRMSTIEIFESLLSMEISNQYTTIVFLDCDNYIYDKQVIRYIKDLLLKYEMNEKFLLNMVMVSNMVCVPQKLERLSEIVFFDLPDDKDLRKHSEHIVSKLGLPKNIQPSPEVVSNLKGLTLFEVEQAYLQSLSLYKSIDLEFIRNFKKSAVAKTDLLTLSSEIVSFDEVGGLDRLKDWINKSSGGWTVEGLEYGLPLLKGLLMIGVSGCGKSLTAKAIGHAWKLPIVNFDPSKVFSSRVGDSESNMRRALQIVDNLAPCVLMIDEIEKAMAGIQSSSYSDSGVTARVISSFLIWMQDNNRPVFVVATANSITDMPPEMISRFDEVFYVNLPQEEERKEIFRIHLAKLKRDPNKFDLPALAKASQDLSGREIEQVLREGMYACFHKKIEINSGAILEVLRNKTTIVSTMAEQINAITSWVGWNEEKNDGVRARFASTPNTLDRDRVQKEIDELLG